MGAYLTMVRRELAAFFLSLTGYVVVASVLLLLGFSFVDLLVKLNGTPTAMPLTELFYITPYFWWILLLTAPVMTMRTFAHEKFSGTYETLMTAPVADWQVVLAKFTGALLIYVLTWLPLLGVLVVIRSYTGAAVVLDARTGASTLLGILLIGCLYMSLGCFASALTRSQILAAMNSLALGLTIFLLGLRSLVPTPASDWAAKVFSYISMCEHMEDFARGIIDTRPMALYLSLTAFFLFLTLKVVESRRWK